ncbi:DUF4291 domain-containing protein [soil metagenome]
MLRKERYREQVARWPKDGQHILAQYEKEGVVVYQAYRPAIGEFAARHQCFGGEFKLSRMSWIKTNFLWMMYRCGWAEKQDQEVVLAITIRCDAFDSILAQAVHSSFTAGKYASHDDWQGRLKHAPVRLQWDPDHDPFGIKQARRAIQLGLSGDVLKNYSRDWILKIEDISAFVAEGRALVAQRNLDDLVIPHEEDYPVADSAVAKHLGVSPALEESCK